MTKYIVGITRIQRCVVGLHNKIHVTRYIYVNKLENKNELIGILRQKP